MKVPEVIIPEWMMNIVYSGRIIPNNTKHDIIKTGANCQVFAFQILRDHDFYVPEYRSSELWADSEFSIVVKKDYEPLDILFFHKDEIAYGAHLAVYLGENKAIHLCKRVGLPVIWDMGVFFKYPEYQILLGGKRFKHYIAP